MASLNGAALTRASTAEQLSKWVALGDTDAIVYFVGDLSYERERPLAERDYLALDVAARAWFFYTEGAVELVRRRADCDGTIFHYIAVRRKHPKKNAIPFGKQRFRL